MDFGAFTLFLATPNLYTLFFLDKNLFYKNVEAEIWPKI